MESSVNTEILRGRVDTFVLNSLKEKDGYGYDILNYIYSKTQGHYEMKQSSIYSVLKRLEKQELISSYLGDESNGGRRRYYALTQKGRDFLNAEQEQWAYTRTLLDNLVTDKHFDLLNDTPPFKASDLRPLTKRIKNEDNFEEDCEENNNSVLAAINEEPTAVTADIEIEHTDSIVVEVPPLAPLSRTSDSIKPDTRNEFFQSEKQEESIFEKPRIIELDDKKSNTYADFYDQFPKSSENAGQTKSYEKIPVNSENKIAYRNIFDTIYERKNETASVVKKQEEPSPNNDDLDCHHINDLKNILKNEGYTLRAYKKEDAILNSKSNYIYSSRILRDTTLLTYLFFALSVLIIYRFRDIFGYSDKSLLIIGLCGLIVPISGLIIYISKSKRRIKSNFNFKLKLVYSFMLFLFIYIVNLIICLVTPEIGLTMKDAKLYPPCILALAVPFSIIAYQILYKSKLYHIKI